MCNVPRENEMYHGKSLAHRWPPRARAPWCPPPPYPPRPTAPSSPPQPADLPPSTTQVKFTHGQTLVCRPTGVVLLIWVGRHLRPSRPAPPPALRQLIQHGVGRAVVGLTGVSAQRGGGGEAEKPLGLPPDRNQHVSQLQYTETCMELSAVCMISLHLRRQGAQVHRAEDFGDDGLLDARAAHLAARNVSLELRNVSSELRNVSLYT